MAPRKRKSPEAPQPATPARVTRSVTRSAERVTRSSAKRTDSAVGSAESGRRTKKLKRAVKGMQQQKKQEEGTDDDQAQGGGSSSNANNSSTIVIEHSTQGNLFKTRAAEVEEGLHDKVDGIIVKVNPKKPRKGCFEIRAEGGEKFISLLRMKRPFKRLKDLDMDKVISGITDKIN